MITCVFERLALETSANEIVIPDMTIQENNSLTSKTKIIRTRDPQKSIGNAHVLEFVLWVPSKQDTFEVVSTFHSPPTSSKDGT